MGTSHDNETRPRRGRRRRIIGTDPAKYVQGQSAPEPHPAEFRAAVMMMAPDAAIAVSSGDRPASAGQLRMIGWRRLVKGPLRGFLTVELWPPGLQVIDCPVLVSNGRA